MKLVGELEKEGVRWQGSGREKVASRPASKQKSSGTANRIFKSNGRGGREVAKERELELERKSDQAGEDLLGYTQEGITQTKVAVTYSGEIKQIWEKKGHTARGLS